MTIMMQSSVEDELPDFDGAKEFYTKYEVKEVLGKGVSSTVRRCMDKSSNVEYAVKIIDLVCPEGQEYMSEEIVAATKKEINILRMVSDHQNIIELHDVFEGATFIFLIFELCKKGELFDYLTEVVTLSEKRTRQVMRQLLESIEYIHSKQIVHRDLKPENILLDDSFNVKVSDFGFATVISHQTELQDLCGTPGYLAPEVLRVSMYDNADGYGQAVDMWACGVIMYTLLVGCPPFWHRKQMYMLRAIMNGDYSFSSPEWHDVSDPPKDLIAKLLVVEPTQRLTAAQALQHPFFKREERPEVKREFYPKRMFKAAAICVRALWRLRHLHLHPPPISKQSVRHDPYSTRLLRKAIDAGAFKIYGHWVKRGENQNRAALFENAPKRDLKVALAAGAEEGLEGCGCRPRLGSLTGTLPGGGVGGAETTFRRGSFGQASSPINMPNSVPVMMKNT